MTLPSLPELCRRAALHVALLALLFAASATSSFSQGWVTIQQDQFAINGQTIRLKGTNYYPREHHWAAMWSSWDWPDIVAESTLIKNLNMNCVRILVPYSHGGWNGPNVPSSRLQMLEDLVNMLGAKGIRSNITLFDWETSFPAAGTSKESDHYKYIDAIVGRLKNNKYVFLWDVKNEPDHPANIGGYDDWDNNPAQRDKIISWLNRMCVKVKSVAPNQHTTVGMRWYNNVPDVLHFVDAACFHSYWSHLTNNTEIPVIKAAMGANKKPIIAQEFGWPTNPTPMWRDGRLVYDYTEAQQLAFYQAELTAFTNHNIAGCIQWMTFDAKNYTSNQNESFENYFGLYKYDLTLKPAATYYRDNFTTRYFPAEPDSIPPSPVTNFTATAGDSQVTLRFNGSGSADAVGTRIRVKTTGYPTSHTDGTLVATINGSGTGQFTHIHGGLTNGTTYYYAAYAYDSSGNFASGATAQAIPFGTVSATKIGTAKNLPENTQVTVSQKLVTAYFPSDYYLYITETDRSASIRVNTTSVIINPVIPGDRVTVTGTIVSRKPDGINVSERELRATAFSKVASGTPVAPLGVSSTNFGGEPLPPYIPGVKDGIGLNNMGSLVTIRGRITQIVSNTVFIDDGAAYEDTSGRIGIFVRCPTVAIPYAVGDLVTATGVIEGSIPTGWTTNRRAMRIRDWSDLVKLQ